MKAISAIAGAVACALSVGAMAHTDGTETIKTSSSHAPAGVMSDHLHAKGEWMVGYRLEHSQYDDYASGTKSLTDREVMMMGYGMIATYMDMNMHMLDIMYAPTEDLTLMLMPHYMTMDMGMNGMMGSRDHTVEGWGDTKFGGLYRLSEDSNVNSHFSLMLSLPTGSIDQVNRMGALTHYGMQLGSGTYDIDPAITMTLQQEQWNFGGQVGGTVRLESANEHGYRLGNKAFATVWSSYDMTNDFSMNARVQYSYQQSIRGEYNKRHATMSPADYTENYGGERMELAVGANLVTHTSLTGTLRWGLEYVQPVYQDLNGVQLQKQRAINFNLSAAF